jgi:hypothetical protein
MEGPTLVIGREDPPEGEDAAIAALAALHLQIHQVQPGPSVRGEHPKQHAGVWGTFTVEPDVPQALRAGLFATPRSYAALIRFSNGRTADDSQPDVRGMALKILVPDGSGSITAQDIVLADHPVFFARDVAHLLHFLRATVERVPFVQIVPNYPALPAFTRVPTTGPLATTYWSQTAYKLGPGAVKYVATPSGGPEPPIASPAGADWLRESLVEQLSVRQIGARFDLAVQPQTDAALMPIEDATVLWTSTPVRVGSLVIPAQQFDDPDQQSVFANLSWNPWNTLDDHRPLGGINRARQRVYRDSFALRHGFMTAAAGASPLM